ncbi:hypothetical protein OA92_03870 [Marinomonas sp. SBI22]|uniref:hypothetical protein n=1 Tax=unclassified Marinomonas TaxID=196814 RepID=UPI0007AF3C0F|nr:MULTISPECIES: hypothetical protein [unclassified Marinomonas]KZM45004.1 hypothetical protein OA92_03870 [Marinomonas sp. SBI22]KZM46703.1 hypothetical protein OA91_02930 [Marinomonas sp. SBI8L]
MKLIQFLKQLLSTLFPFIYLYGLEKRKLAEANDCLAEANSFFYDLDRSVVESRLKEEHLRSKLIDDKTSKFNLGLSLCLTIIGVAATTVAKLLPDHELKPLIIAFLSIASLFMLIGGLVSLSAFKLMPTYGYGSRFEYLKSRNERVETTKALIGQENVNLIKQVRNEVAYQCLRNGFVSLFIALIVISYTSVLNAYVTSPKAMSLISYLKCLFS